MSKATSSFDGSTTPGAEASAVKSFYALRYVWLIATCVSIGLFGCAMYNHPYPFTSVPGAKFDVRVIQSDEYGSLWDASAAQDTLQLVENYSKQTNTLVVLFIHGWHHNASPEDQNLQDSIKALNALYSELDTDERRKLRYDLTGQRDFKLVGINVGWRGRSLPGLADYLTIWGRKNAAERVGEGDVSEFIERLQRIFLRTNAYDPSAPDPKKPFTGLVSLGHSLGAQVLWKSLFRQLEDPLAERAPCFANALDPAESKPTTKVRVAINGLGDLNILLNPALEAYQLARVDSLYRQLKFPIAQRPQLVVFSADNDRGRQALFPLARAVTGPFRPNFRSDDDGYQGKLWGRALGEVSEQQTHVLVRSSANDSLREDDYADRTKIRNFDFTGNTVFNKISMEPSPRSDADPKRAERVPYSPLLVVQTRQKIINGHNGIFEEDFRLFLAKYVAYVEGKRILLRLERLQRGEQPISAEKADSSCGVN